MKRKLLAILLSLAILLTLLPPGAAMAADDDQIIVGGKPFIVSKEKPVVYATTNDEGEMTQGGNENSYNIKWDGETLTLRDATIKGAAGPFMNVYQGACVQASHGYKVEIIGDNKLIGANVETKGFAYTYGLYATTTDGSADITISGKGSLTYNGENVTAKATDPETTISTARRVIHAAVYADNGSVNIQGGTLTLNAGSASTEEKTYNSNGGSITTESYGIYANSRNSTAANINISGGTVTAKAGTVKNLAEDINKGGYSVGIRAVNGDVNISDGDVTATTAMAEGESEDTGYYYRSIMAGGKGGVTIDPAEEKVISWKMGVDADSVTSSGTLTYKDEAQSLTQPFPKYFQSTTTEYIHVSNVTLNETSLTLNVGEEAMLTPTISPAGAMDKNVTWASDSSSVATVDRNGKVTAKAPGTATITATVDGQYATCKVTVPKLVTSVSLNKDELTLTTGNTEKLIATVEPNDATNQTVEWKSDDENIATVDMNGTVTAKAPGTTTITVTSTDGSNKSDSCTVTVKRLVTSVSLNKNTLTLTTGSSETLSVTVTPNDAATKTVEWKSSDEKIASVDQNGKVTAVAPGTTTITATSKDGSNKSASCTVTVQAAPVYSIVADKTKLDFGSIYENDAVPDAQTVTITNNGNQPLMITQPAAQNFTISTKDSLTVAAGGNVTFTVQPNANLATGSYHETLQFTTGQGQSVRVAVQFTVKENPYTGRYSYEIFNEDGDNGTVDVNRYATEGERVTIAVSPDGGYDLDQIMITGKNGEKIDFVENSDGTISFMMPSCDVTIVTEFAESDEPEPEPEPGLPFIDVHENDWFYDVVRYVYDKGLMTGTSDTEFSPNLTTTRGMIVSILNRLEDGPTAEAAGFTDVADGDWYADAVNWAASEGIVVGFEDDTFRPNDLITREQLAAIFCNYAEWKGMDISSRADLSNYNDAASVSSWAAETVQWAIAEGLITGMPGNLLEPQGSATRAQVAAILERFLEQ